jgi:hypothetical protein
MKMSKKQFLSMLSLGPKLAVAMKAKKAGAFRDKRREFMRKMCRHRIRPFEA